MVPWVCTDRGLAQESKRHKSAALFRLLTQNYGGTQERNRTVRITNTQKEKAEKDNSVCKIEIKLQFPYIVSTQYEHRTAAHLRYHCELRIRTK